MYTFTLNLPCEFSPGEYEYYFTTDRDTDFDIDINNIAEVKTNVFCAGKLIPVISENNIIFVSKGTSILQAPRDVELCKRINILSSGILKYNIEPHYHEREQQREADYTEYQG